MIQGGILDDIKLCYRSKSLCRETLYIAPLNVSASSCSTTIAVILQIFRSLLIIYGLDELLRHSIIHYSFYLPFYLFIFYLFCHSWKLLLLSQCNNTCSIIVYTLRTRTHAHRRREQVIVTVRTYVSITTPISLLVLYIINIDSLPLYLTDYGSRRIRFVRFNSLFDVRPTSGTYELYIVLEC